MTAAGLNLCIVYFAVLTCWPEAGQTVVQPFWANGIDQSLNLEYYGCDKVL